MRVLCLLSLGVLSLLALANVFAEKRVEYIDLRFEHKSENNESILHWSILVPENNVDTKACHLIMGCGNAMVSIPLSDVLKAGLSISQNIVPFDNGACFSYKYAIGNNIMVSAFFNLEVSGCAIRDIRLYPLDGKQRKGTPIFLIAAGLPKTDELLANAMFWGNGTDDKTSADSIWVALAYTDMGIVPGTVINIPSAGDLAAIRKPLTITSNEQDYLDYKGSHWKAPLLSAAVLKTEPGTADNIAVAQESLTFGIVAYEVGVKNFISVLERECSLLRLYLMSPSLSAELRAAIEKNLRQAEADLNELKANMEKGRYQNITVVPRDAKQD